MPRSLLLSLAVGGTLAMSDTALSIYDFALIAVFPVAGAGLIYGMVKMDYWLAQFAAGSMILAAAMLF
ncbi:hypothetical protein [Mesorhizobium ciceri]|uniref:hypothetical protein n=1 Tax=Mesorhizobium TaxID=68287 RepID=UPI0012DD2F5D|nr:hypothetical protein [Mesorhizobium ciceri]